MREKIMAICDTEEGYAFRMAEYFLEKVKLPYAVHLFTAVEELEKFAKREEIEVLLIAESAWRLLKEEYVRQQVAQLFILQESESAAQTDLCCISKYQSPEKVVRAVLDGIAEGDGWKGDFTATDAAAKMIGIYSPIKRCLQTSFALTLGQLLAKEHKTLYLNFEMYSGLGEILRREYQGDMMDVVYYFQSAREKLALRLPTIIQNAGGLDYIPPMQYALGIREVPGEQWLALCRDLAAIGEYEYLILDLDNGMEGLFELLKNCQKIYTITRDDPFAAAKLRQYEQMLLANELEEIADKTVKCRFPIFQELPASLDMMTHGELANYVRAILREDIYGD
ncbi:MAG: hypothetical protein NC302_07795 [Bacteroidales bacterium]|nr:hypothetical protein [Bacteroidales bacterium]MCM1415565.1 hypothetical protein [bacterium]MCM1424093.1 hypothetical protein [bacterium]